MSQSCDELNKYGDAVLGLASIASKGKSPAEPKQVTSTPFEHPKYTQVQPEVEPQQGKSTEDVPTSSKDTAGQDELNIYLVDVLTCTRVISPRMQCIRLCKRTLL